jgi:hypothetical protein
VPDINPDLYDLFGLGDEKPKQKKVKEEPKPAKVVTRPEPVRATTPEPAEQSFVPDWLRSAGRVGLGVLEGAQNIVADTAGKALETGVGRAVLRPVYGALDTLDALRGGTQAAALTVADKIDDQPMIQTAKDAVKAGGRAVKRTIVDQAPERSFREELGDRGVEMGPVEGLLADIAMDPTNVIPGKAIAGVAKAGVGLAAIPKLAKVAKAADVAGDVAKVADEAPKFGRAIEKGTPVYHGATKHGDKVLSLDKADPDALYGPGQYFTESPDVAAGYAGRQAKWQRPDTLDSADVGSTFKFRPSEAEDSYTLVEVGKQDRSGKAVHIFRHDSSGEILKKEFDVRTDSAGRLVDQGMENNLLYKTSYDQGASVRKAELDIQNALDMDAPMKPEAARQFIEVASRKIGIPDAEIADDIARMADEWQGQMPTGGDLYRRMEDYLSSVDEMQRLKKYEATPRDPNEIADFSDLMDDQPFFPKKILNEALAESGYDGITHIGGAVTGSPEHRVWIALQEGRAKAPWGTDVGAINPALLANMGMTAGGAAAGAAANKDSDILPGGMLSGALAGAAGGSLLARGAIGVGRGISKAGAVGAAMGKTAGQTADEIASVQPVVERLMRVVPDRAEALGVTAVGADSKHVINKADDLARTDQWLARNVGVTNAGDRAVVTKILEGGDDYLMWKHRRMNVTEDAATGQVKAVSRSWQDDTKESWKIAWDGVKLPRGTTLNAAQVESLERKVRGLSERMMDVTDDAASLQKAVAANDVQTAQALMDKWNVKSPQALDILADQAAEEAMVGWRSVTGVRSELGRGLNSLKKKIAYRAVAESDDQFIKRMSEMGIEGSEMRQQIQTLKTPQQRYKYLRDRASATSSDLFRWYYISSLLSGPKTHARNLISNAVNMVAMDAGFVLGRGTDVVRGRLPWQDFTNEAAQMIHGQRVGVVQGWKEAMQVWREGFSLEDARVFAEKPPDIKASDILGTRAFDSETTTRWLNSVSRFLEASDQFSRTIMFSGALHSGAYAHASKLVKSGKIKPSQFRQTVDAIIADPNIVAPSVFDEAVQVAKDSVYRQDAGKLLQSIIGAQKAVDEFGQKVVGGAIAKIPIKPVRVVANVVTAPVQNLGSLVMPFIKTPAGVFKKQFRAMGGGLYTSKQFAEQGQDIMAAIHRGEGMLGAGLVAALATYALASDRPLVTGVGPNNPELAEDPSKALDAFYGSHRPNSFRLPGTDQWIDYRSLGPVAGPMSIVGNLSDAARQGRELNGAALADALARQGRSMLSNSFLTGVMGAVSAFEDRTGVSANRTIGRTVAGLVPASGAMRTGRQVTDDVIRDTRDETLLGSVEQNIKNITPGLSTQVPARVDYAGQVLRNPGNPLERAASPADHARVPEDQVRVELAKLGAEAYLVKPPKDLKDELGNPMDLTKLQSTELQRAVGISQYEVAKQLLAVPGFTSLPPDVRAKMLREAMSDARDAAKDNYRAYVRSVSTSRPR